MNGMRMWGPDCYIKWLCLQFLAGIAVSLKN